MTLSEPTHSYMAMLVHASPPGSETVIELVTDFLEWLEFNYPQVTVIRSHAPTGFVVLQTTATCAHQIEADYSWVCLLRNP